MRGAFITLEGTEGVGKSSSLQYIETLLESPQRRVLVTREPGGTALGESIRELILASSRGSLSAITESMLMFAARSNHVEKVIRPALERGEWVLCDRFTDATLAYQGGGREADIEFLAELSSAVTGGLKPDLTLLLDADPGVGFQRIGDRDKDHFEQEDLAFFERVRHTYLALASTEPARFSIIDAAQDSAVVHNDLRDVIEAFVRNFEARRD